MRVEGCIPDVELNQGIGLGTEVVMRARSTNHRSLTMNRTFSSLPVAFVLLTSVACTRQIRVPAPVGQQPEVLEISRGVNASATVGEYQLSRVSVVQPQPTTSVNLHLGDIVGKKKVDETRVFSFSMTKRGAPLTTASCTGHQFGDVNTIMGTRTDKTQHVLTCRGSVFSMQIDEPSKNSLTGTVSAGDQQFVVETTNDMARGLPESVNGFTLRQGGNWVASVEYFWGGRAYLSPSLSSEERDSAMTAVLALLSTNHWLGRDANENQGSAL